MENKSAIKMLVMDLDGTLLTSKETVTKRTVEAIAAVNALGIKTVAATGRIYQEAEFALLQAGIKDYLIEMNGGRITDLRQNRLLHEKYFAKALARQVIQTLADNYVFQVYTDAGVYCTPYSLARLEKAGMSVHYLKMFGSKIQEFSPQDLISRNVFKFLVIEKNPEKVRQLYDYAAAFPEIICVNSMSNYYEILLSGLDKKHALSFLCRQTGILPKEVLAIGDSDNDRKMLQFAGRGVVLANAKETLQAEIGKVFPTNDEEGVLKAIEAYCLGDEITI